MSTILAESATVSSEPESVKRRRGGLMRAILHNRKAIVGLALFLLFCLAAAFPHIFVPWLHGKPDAVGQFDSELHPSLRHWLGTTQLGQDVYAELIYGTRESLVIAIVAGLGSTVISVVIGVSAAYLGGVADDLLSLFTDVFLVLPAFPLIIVLATFAGKGSLGVVVVLVPARAFRQRQGAVPRLIERHLQHRWRAVGRCAQAGCSDRPRRCVRRRDERGLGGNLRPRVGVEDGQAERDGRERGSEHEPQPRRHARLRTARRRPVDE